MMSEEDTYLNDVWNLYFHDPYDVNWNNSSYIRLGTIGSVDDFWMHHTCLKPNLAKGMFFMMRDGIFPAWDASPNINGGCLSIKVLKEFLPELWEDIVIKILGETIVKEPQRVDAWSSINGISTSPKKHFCIIKLWLKDKVLSSKDYFHILPKYHGDIIFKSNMDYIAAENAARTQKLTQGNTD